jgi:enoyl-CoA hydratase/carnithine racemase
MSDRVLISIHDGIADVRFNRPDKRNALDSEQFLAIAAAGERLKAEPGVRVVVLSGAGASFCAGLDLSTMAVLANQAPPKATERTEGTGAVGTAEADGAESDESTGADGNPGRLTASGITHLGQQVCWVWQELAVPVLAAVQGHALGGGLQIALGADIRLVHPATQLSVREVYWGLVPDMTGTFTLSSLCRPDIAKELTFTARVFSGSEAGKYGIATHVTETPYDDAMVLAREIADRSPSAVQASKALFNRLANDRAAGQFAAERAHIQALIGSANQLEAVLAGLQKRPAVFTD